MAQSAPKRETFSGRNAFIMAAIGSAVGLGNIMKMVGALLLSLILLHY